MKNLRALSKLLCVILIFSFFAEIPLKANPPESVKIDIGGQTLQVTPGQWVTVTQGNQPVTYNVRYVDGKLVALNQDQYNRLVFGGNGAVDARKRSKKMDRYTKKRILGDFSTVS
ncbi:MAG: hypothetical protein HQM08_11375 [Candidatus Riflebacteria bacterium]|nr:hypothetical protein [Candidatus Riflebacteria bacterium]